MASSEQIDMTTKITELATVLLARAPVNDTEAIEMASRWDAVNKSFQQATATLPLDFYSIALLHQSETFVLLQEATNDNAGEDAASEEEDDNEVLKLSIMTAKMLMKNENAISLPAVWHRRSLWHQVLISKDVHQPLLCYLQYKMRVFAWADANPKDLDARNVRAQGEPDEAALGRKKERKKGREQENRRVEWDEQKEAKKPRRDRRYIAQVFRLRFVVCTVAEVAA